jgi:1,4-dihydroxy-2-naphthoate octaprenyltransferase
VLKIIEGMKLVFHRMVHGMFIMICLMPIWNLVLLFVNGEITENSYTYCVDSIDYVKLGVGMIPSLIFIGIGIAIFHTYYRAVQQRQYEAQYTQEGLYNNGYNK